MQNAQHITSFTSALPLSTAEKFANDCGLPVDVVRGWVEKGLIPSVKIGKRRMINLVLLGDQCRNGFPEIDYEGTACPARSASEDRARSARVIKLSTTRTVQSAGVGIAPPLSNTGEQK